MDANSGKFTATVKDYTISEGQNIRLWLAGTLALSYAGLFNSKHMTINAQSGLDNDNEVVGIILASGVAALPQVSPTPGSLNQLEAMRLGTMLGIVSRI